MSGEAPTWASSSTCAPDPNSSGTLDAVPAVLPLCVAPSLSPAQPRQQRYAVISPTLKALLTSHSLHATASPLCSPLEQSHEKVLYEFAISFHPPILPKSMPNHQALVLTTPPKQLKAETNKQEKQKLQVGLLCFSSQTPHLSEQKPKSSRAHEIWPLTHYLASFPTSPPSMVASCFTSNTSPLKKVPRLFPGAC